MNTFSQLFIVSTLSYASYSLSAPIEAGQPAVQNQAITVDASSSTAAAYLRFEDGVLSSSAADSDWQIAVKRTHFQTNSGTSGKGNVGVFNSEETDFAAVTTCVVPSLAIDEQIPASGAPGSVASSGNAVLNAWYSYDMSTHTVASKEHVYLVVDGDSCFKFQILAYSSGVYSVQAAALDIPGKVEPELEVPLVFEQTIDASFVDRTVYLALEAGQLVPSSIDSDWLLAVKRTQFQTNSGTSGEGGVGVANSGSSDFAAVTSCQGLSYSFDSLLPASGAPGSQPYSGSAVLNAWYNYDMSTHTVTSKQDVYALSNGEQCVKLQILGYEAGRFTVQVSQLN